MQIQYPNNGFRSYWNYLSKRTAFGSGNLFSKLLSALQTAFKLIGQVLKDAGIELFFLLLFWLVITKMGQGRDLIVSLFEPDGIYGLMRIFWTVLSVISLSVSMWIIPAFLFQQRDRKNKDGRFFRSVFKEHLFFVHRVLPLIPFWLVAFVLFNGKYVYLVFILFSLLELWIFFLIDDKLNKNQKQWCIGTVTLLLIVFVACFCITFHKTYYWPKVVLAVILYLISFLAYFSYQEVDRQILEEHEKDDNIQVRPVKKYWKNSLFYISYLIVHAGIVIYIFCEPGFNQAPESMMLYIFSLNVFIIDLFVYFINVSARRKLLATTGVIIILLLYLTPYVNLNVSHYTIDPIRDSSVLRGRERLTFAHRYADLKERILSNKSGEPYPIILISGEGGGSRAGMWLSQNLINFDYYTRGRFRDHIFSVSTVSGSSVGLSTVFAFWEQPQKGDSIDHKWLYLPSEIYANNFVGSSISGLLLTDFWKSLVPFGLDIETDRNSTLQDDEAYYTQKACFRIKEGRKMKRGEIPEDQWVLTKDFMRFFYDTAGGTLSFRKDRPLAFINTCRSNDGRRGIISPVKLGNDFFNDALDIAAYLYDSSVCDHKGNILCKGIKKNISLGQACNTSELFPLFSAPAYIDSLGSFVDGGYHENSGLKTTLDVYEKLRDTLLEQDSLKGKYRIYIVYFKNGSSEKELYKPLPSEPPLTLPLTALFSQPFEGSTSYFEERTKFTNKNDSFLHYIEVKLNHRLIVDTSEAYRDSIKTKQTYRDSVIEKQILKDLTGAKDTAKKDITLNFPLARWLSKSVIRFMGLDASLHNSPNDSLKSLLDRINSVNHTTKASMEPFIKLRFGVHDNTILERADGKKSQR